MKIVKCTDKDAGELARMNKCLIEDEKSDNPMTVRQLERRMLTFLSGDHEAFFFEEDNKILGYALIRNDEKPLYLRQFYIEREFRRKHLGREAFELLMDHLGTSVIDIDCLPWNKAGMSFWKSMGFAETCISMRYRRK